MSKQIQFKNFVWIWSKFLNQYKTKKRMSNPVFSLSCRKSKHYYILLEHREEFYLTFFTEFALISFTTKAFKTSRFVKTASPIFTRHSVAFVDVSEEEQQLKK